MSEEEQNAAPAEPVAPTETPAPAKRAPRAKAPKAAPAKASKAKAPAKAPKAPAREPLGETVQVGIRIPADLVSAKHKMPRENGGFAGVLRSRWEAGHTEKPAKVAEGTKMVTRTIGFPTAIAKQVKAFRDAEGNDFNGWVVAVLQRALKGQ